jgi:hypothetical protein
MNEIKNEIINSVREYDKRPEYRLRIYSSNCNWQLKLNDMPIDKFTEAQGGKSGNLPLNYMIPKSGIQELKLLVQPLKGDKTLGEYATFRMTLEYYKDNQDYDNFMEIYSFVLPIDSVKEAPQFDHSYNFEAEVPYIMYDWNNSKNLKDVPDIEKKILKKYEELKSILINVNKESYFRLKKKTYIVMYQTFYTSKSRIQDDLNEDDEFLESARGASFYPIEEYKLVFHANGKVAELIRKDGGCCIQFKVDEETVNSVGMLLYMPANSNELEVIR